MSGPPVARLTGTVSGGRSGAATFTMSGQVVRLASAPIAEGEDGIGTLYVAAFASCDLGQTPLGVFALPGADLSDEAVGVPWTISGLPPGLRLTDAGVLRGIPTDTGSFVVDFTVRNTTSAAVARRRTSCMGRGSRSWRVTRC